ncbi:MAG: hypothetical protein IPJ65_24155 [Archangiaceae bacterium]|nr:hypothetical protein [Archangiaceae bacterium]
MPLSAGLAVWLVLAATDAGVAPRFDWDVPKLLADARVGSGRIDVSGLPLDMHVVRSGWKANELAIHYARRFIEAGFFIPPDQKPFPGSSLRRLTAFDPVTMQSYTLIFYAEEDGTTTVVLGAADLGHRRAAGLERFPAPVLPGARAATVFELEAARALSFTTAASESELASFYRQTLIGAGWRERAPGSYVRAGRQLRVMVKREGPAGPLAVVVLEDADRGEPAK